MGGSSTPSHTSQTTEPWEEAASYLTGSGGQTGIFDSAENFFNTYKELSPQQQGLNADYFGTLGGRQGDIGQMQITGQNMMGGAYDPTAGPVDLNQGWNAMGGADPTQALQRSLSGNADNPFLQAMHQGNINTSLRGYGDSVRDLMTNVMPGISDQAFASGQYGGSRQGVAEGLAMEQMLRNSRDLGIAAMDSGNQLYGSAYENAQGRMSNMAQYLSGLSGQNQQFNAGLDLQQRAAAAQNALQGINAMQNAFGSADNVYNQQQSLLNAPMQQYQNALNQYSNILFPGSALGGTQNSSIPIYSNTMGQVVGGALGTAGLLGGLSGG